MLSLTARTLAVISFSFTAGVYGRLPAPATDTRNRSRPASATKKEPPAERRAAHTVTEAVSRAYLDTLKSIGCAIHTPTALSRFMAGEKSICSTI